MKIVALTEETKKNLLKDLLENKGCKVEDLYVSTMPALDNKLCIVVEFYIGWQNF